MFIWTRTMPFEVPFSSSIVLTIIVIAVVVVDIVYVVASLAANLSHYSPFNLFGLENPLAAKRRAFYIRNVEFFHDFRLVLRCSFSQTARMYAHVLCTHATAAAALSSVKVITFVFLLTLHRRTGSHQNIWEIKSANGKNTVSLLTVSHFWSDILIEILRF